MKKNFLCKKLDEYFKDVPNKQHTRSKENIFIPRAKICFLNIRFFFVERQGIGMRYRKIKKNENNSVK